MDTAIPEEAAPTNVKRTLALTVLIVIAGVFTSCASDVQLTETAEALEPAEAAQPAEVVEAAEAAEPAEVVEPEGTADAVDTAQISPHSCIEDLVTVLVPGHVEGFAEVNADLQAALENGPITLDGEIADDIFRSNDGLVIEIQSGTVECDLDGGY